MIPLRMGQRSPYERVYWQSGTPCFYVSLRARPDAPEMLDDPVLREEVDRAILDAVEEHWVDRIDLMADVAAEPLRLVPPPR